jgi:hypothetical protein
MASGCGGNAPEEVSVPKAHYNIWNFRADCQTASRENYFTPQYRPVAAILGESRSFDWTSTPGSVHIHTSMASRSSIPKGATGIYRSDCPTSPPQFEDGESLTVVKKGPPGHCIVVGTSGIETVIRNSEFVLDEQLVDVPGPMTTRDTRKIQLRSRTIQMLVTHFIR